MAKKKAEPVAEEPKPQITVEARQYVELRLNGWNIAKHLTADEAYDLGWKLRTAAQEIS